jgi:hypothetical protein
MNGEMPDISNPSTESQVLVSQALLEEMQRQLQELQAAAALQAALSPVTPPAPEHPPFTTGQHLKSNRPTRYSGIKNHTTIKNWITLVNSYFVLTGAKSPHIYHYLNTTFTDEVAIWFCYHYREDQATHLLDKFPCELKPKTRMELEFKDPQTLAEAIRLADRFNSICLSKDYLLDSLDSLTLSSQWQ